MNKRRKHFYFPGSFMDYPFCEKTNCVNYKKGRCILKNPEKDKESCLHYEDMTDSLRLNVDTFKGEPQKRIKGNLTNSIMFIVLDMKK